MPQLIQIKDFQFIALKDSMNITDENRKSFASMAMNDKYFSSKIVDVPTSLALISEFDKCPYSKNDFVNDLDKENPEFTESDEYIYVYPSYSIKSEEIPLLLKKAGMQIKREQCIAYIAPGTDLKTPYVLVNKDGSDFEAEEVNSKGFTNVLNIKLYDEVLALRKDEYSKYLKVKEMFNEGLYKYVPKQDLYLWALTKTFIDKQEEKKYVAFHEIRHAQNNIIFFDFLFDNQKNCKLSVADLFKKERDDELSANIAEVICAINEYNKSGDKDNFSMIKGSNVLNRLLCNRNIDEWEKTLADIPSVIKEVCKDWYNIFDSEYMKQFLQNVSARLKQVPLKYLSEEADGTAYASIRKLMFTYNIYDPRTGKYVSADLSKFVPDFGINSELLDFLKEMHSKNIIERISDIINWADKIDYSLVVNAQELYRKNVYKTEYRKTLTELQKKGMSYMSALNYIPMEKEDKKINKFFSNIFNMVQKKR